MRKMKKRIPSMSPAAARLRLLSIALSALVLTSTFALAQQAPAPTQAPVTSTNGVAKPKKQVLIFENADLRVVLQAMAKQEGLSLILPDDVKGNVTARLVDIPIRQAMETILSSKGFSLVELDGVYQVKSKDAINSEPLKNEIYQFANASAKDAKSLVEKLLSKASGANVQLDERSNTLLITDAPSNLTKILPIIKTLDQPTQQVLIEARLLETQRQPTENIGVQWSSSFTSTLYPSDLMVTERGPNDGGGYGVSSRRIPVANNATVPFTAQPPTYAGLASGSIGPLAGLGFPAVAVLTLPSLQATLNLLMQDQDTELLGSPKVLTADNREAKIAISRSEPIPNYSFNQQTASYGISGFEYKDLGNFLVVTPHINKDEFVTLDVVPTVSGSTETRQFQTGGAGSVPVNIPVISTRTLTTRVTLKSGNTLALGGLLSLSSTRTYNKVPFLGDIPGLGELFTNRSFSKIKRNLLIFITPTVVASDGKSGLEDQYDKLKETDESDRYAYKKNFIGNAKPLDQYHSVPKQDMELSTTIVPPNPISTVPHDVKASSSMEVPPKSAQVSTGSIQPKFVPSIATEPMRSEKEEAIRKASAEKKASADLNQDNLNPRLVPGLRE